MSDLEKRVEHALNQITFTEVGEERQALIKELSEINRKLAQALRFYAKEQNYHGEILADEGCYAEITLKELNIPIEG